MSMFRAYHQGNTAAATAAAAPAVDTGANRNMVSVPGDLSLVYPHAAAAAAWNFNVFHRGNQPTAPRVTASVSPPCLTIIIKHV